MVLNNIKMKQRILSFATCLAFCMLVFSCSNNSEVDEDGHSAISSKKTELNSIFGFSSWQDMIAYYMDGDGAGWFEEQGLKLVSYEMVGTTTVTDLFMSSTTDAIMPIYSSDNILEAISLVDAVSAENRNKYFTTKKTYLSYYKGEVLGLLKIKWSYKGNTYLSQACVSNSIVVYDDIMYNIYTIGNNNNLKRAPIIRLKTRQEIISDPQDYSTDTVKYIIMGRTIASAMAKATVGYNDDGFHVEKNCYADALDGGKADAEINYTVDGENCILYYAAIAGPISMEYTWTGKEFRVLRGTANCYNGSWTIHSSEVSW